MNKIYSLFLGSFISINGFGEEVPLLKNLSSRAFIQAYDGSEEDREALRSVQSHLYDFSNCIIEDKDFSGENLQGVNFRNCRLINVNFNHANLTNANFEGITTKNVTFEGATLWKDFIYTSELSDEEKVKLYHQIIINIERLTKKNEVDVEKNKFYCLNFLVFAAYPLRLQNLDLSQLDLRQINLQGSIIENVNLSGSILSFAKLNNSCLTNVNLENANLLDIRLKKAKFKNIILSNNTIQFNEVNTLKKYSGLIIFKSIRLDNDINIANKLLFILIQSKNSYLVEQPYLVSFSSLLSINNLLKCFEIKFNNYNFSQFNRPNHKLNLEDIDLENADLEKCNFIKVNLSYSKLAHANLSQGNFSDANLEKADLTGANLTSVNFTGTNLRGTHLQGARLTPDYCLPDKFDDQELLDFYQNVPSHVKEIMKQILIGKGLIQEGEEPPTKKIRRN